MRGGVYGRLGNAKFILLMILLYSRTSSSITLSNHTQNLQKNNTKQVCWIIQGGDLDTNYTNKV